jgi:putative phosphoesterase
MKIAILSDIHDNIWKLASVLEDVRRIEAGELIFCGDLCSPFTLKQIGEGMPGPVHVVLGNNDGDPMLLSKIAAGLSNVRLHGLFAYLTLDGQKVAITHYPPLGRDQALAGQYALVCYGHDHQAHIERVGHTTLVNPGEVMGRLGKSTYAVYDTATRTAEIREV